MNFATDWLSAFPVIGPMFQAGAQKGQLDQINSEQAAGQQKIQDYWAGQQAHAEANYKPLQDMFARAYGKGLDQPVMPGQQAVPNLQSLMGAGKKAGSK